MMESDLTVDFYTILRQTGFCVRLEGGPVLLFTRIQKITHRLFRLPFEVGLNVLSTFVAKWQARIRKEAFYVIIR